MKNIFYRLSNIFFKKVSVKLNKEKQICQDSKEKSFYELIKNPPKSAENIFDLIIPKELKEKKELLIELNKYYYQNRNTVTKENIDKIKSLQNKVLIEYYFDIGSSLKSPYDYGDRAIAKAELFDSLGAISDFSMAITLDPEYENAYIWRGEEKFKICDYKGAILDYQLALELNSNNSETFLNLGNAKLKLGNIDSALKDLNNATTLGNKKSEQIIKDFKENQ
jgi:tetratricopeptide (TPR) repeat protein